MISVLISLRHPRSAIPIVPPAITFALCLSLLAALPARGEIAVFTDGRILKVEDARLEGNQIVLELGQGASLVVPAVRIDRVVADEIEDQPRPVEGATCPAAWANEPLPEWVPFRDAIHAAARASDVHPWLLAALVQAESAFDPRAISRAGAKGLTQLMPAAAYDHHVQDPFDPEDNLRGGAAHLRLMLDRFGSLTLALAAYNAGAAAVERYGDVPPYAETRAYVRRIVAAFCPSGDERPAAPASPASH